MSKKSQKKQLHRQIYSDLMSAKDHQKRFGADGYCKVLLKLVQRNIKTLSML